MALTEVDVSRLNDNVFNTTGPFTNRIINGDMRIDQRNAGASSTPSATTYLLDRWKFEVSQASKFTVGQNLNSATTQTGFPNYLGFQVASAVSVGATDYFIINQRIEGFNFADLAWGTASASPITLSFWVRSSLTGTFGGCMSNYAVTRAYPFTYTINTANIWEYKTVTIAGDTSGTWPGSSNSGAAQLTFGLGVGSTYSGTAGSWATTSYTASATGATSVVGTNGATFYITGVQLEAGTVATPFERRSYGQELALCQRYYYKTQNGNAGNGGARTSTIANIYTKFLVPMRAAPTALEQSGVAADYYIGYKATATNCTSVPSFVNATTEEAMSFFTSSAGVLTAGEATSGFNMYLAWSAEL